MEKLTREVILKSPTYHATRIIDELNHHIYPLIENKTVEQIAKQYSISKRKAKKMLAGDYESFTIEKIAEILLISGKLPVFSINDMELL